jgi:hypothetical protein
MKAPLPIGFGKPLGRGWHQVDQMVRIFSCWVILWVFFNTVEEQIFMLLSPRKMLFKYHFEKIGLGYILGDFFTNSSGHPDGMLFTRTIEPI